MFWATVSKECKKKDLWRVLPNCYQELRTGLCGCSILHNGNLCCVSSSAFPTFELLGKFQEFYMNITQLEITPTNLTTVKGMFCRMCYNTTAVGNFSVDFGVMKMTNKLL